MSQVNRREIMANNELYYLETLEKAFYEMFHRIHFHPNPKYPVEAVNFTVADADGMAKYINFRMPNDNVVATALPSVKVEFTEHD